MTAHGKIRHGHRFSCRNPELLTNEVNARHQFCDWMLDLNAGVHLKEMEGAVVFHEEFNRACPDVIHRLCGGDGGLAHALTLFVVDHRAGRLFEHLLMAALDAAFTFTQVNGGAVCISQDLYFHDAPPQEAFEVHTSVAKGRMASRRAPRTASSRPSADSTARMPFPPPPALAFSSKGNPTRAEASRTADSVAARSASSSPVDSISISSPGMTERRLRAS